MVANKVTVNGASIDLDEVVKLKSIEELKALEIFSDNADASNQAVWDAAQALKEKEVPEAKVTVEKPKRVKA